MWLLSLPFSLLSFKCSAQNFLCDFITGPCYCALECTIFASFAVSFTFFCLPSLIRAKVPSDTQISGVGVHPLPLAQAQYEHPPPCYVKSPWMFSAMYTIHSELAIVMQCLLSSVSSTLFFPQSRIVGDTLCILLQNHYHNLCHNTYHLQKFPFTLLIIYYYICFCGVDNNMGHGDSEGHLWALKGQTPPCTCLFLLLPSIQFSGPSFV